MYTFEKKLHTSSMTSERRIVKEPLYNNYRAHNLQMHLTVTTTALKSLLIALSIDIDGFFFQNISVSMHSV